MLRRGVFLLFIATAGAPNLSAQGAADTAALERINAAITRAQEELAGSRSQRSAVAAEIEASEKAILDNRRELESVRAQLMRQQAALDALRTRQQQLEADSGTQRALIATYVRSAWMSGNEEYLKLLLNQDDPRHAARMMRYYGYLSAARAGKLEAYRLTLDELARVAIETESATVALVEQQGMLAEQQQSLAANQQQRQQLLARLDADLAARDTELAQLEMDKVEIELLLQELQSSLTDIPTDVEQEPFADRKGQLSWPLDGPHTNRFGERHTLGDLTWEGVTIGATAGADVRAIHHGRVVFADWFTTSGLLLIIDHGDGYMSLYAHNQELYKAVGEWVAAGDVIAAAGNTGGQRDTGLYFEIRRNGRAENPANWCRPR